MTGNDFRIKLVSLMNDKKFGYPETLSKVLYHYNKNGNKEHMTAEYVKRYVFGSKDVSTSIIEQVCEKYGIPFGAFYTNNVKSIDDSKYHELLELSQKVKNENKKIHNTNILLKKENISIRLMNEIAVLVLKQANISDIQKKLNQTPSANFEAVILSYLQSNGKTITDDTTKTIEYNKK